MKARLCLDMPISAAGHGASTALGLVGRRMVKKPASSCARFGDSTVPFEDEEFGRNRICLELQMLWGDLDMAMERGCSSKLDLKKWVSAKRS